MSRGEGGVGAPAGQAASDGGCESVVGPCLLLRVEVVWSFVRKIGTLVKTWALADPCGRGPGRRQPEGAFRCCVFTDWLEVCSGVVTTTSVVRGSVIVERDGWELGMEGCRAGRLREGYENLGKEVMLGDFRGRSRRRIAVRGRCDRRRLSRGAGRAASTICGGGRGVICLGRRGRARRVEVRNCRVLGGAGEEDGGWSEWWGSGQSDVAALLFLEDSSGRESEGVLTPWRIVSRMIVRQWLWREFLGEREVEQRAKGIAVVVRGAKCSPGWVERGGGELIDLEVDAEVGCRGWLAAMELEDQDSMLGFMGGGQTRGALRQLDAPD
ncbi:hypothetical protein Tco_1430429 [Tanacetum coccineum]